nr:hypothetical protein CFP56_44288 [Quercus suber]
MSPAVCRDNSFRIMDSVMSSPLMPQVQSRACYNHALNLTTGSLPSALPPSMSSAYARLREQTMVSQEDEEAVTVNTRALIDKVLARYSGEWTTLRELIQNAADAQAKKVTIRFETHPSATVPLPQSQDTAEHLKHTLLHHTLKTLLVTNDGERFRDQDWARLKRIAEGNPDETKIGAFGVGFYSVFADCETPFVSSGSESMAFYWKKDSLFTRRGKLPAEQASAGTTFLLDYRNSTTPVPQLLSICQFLATSLTFVGLECIELLLDDYNIMSLNKKMSPGAGISIPRDVNPKTKGELMKITGVEHQNAQIDARWTNIVGWDRTTVPASSTAVQHQAHPDAGGSLRSWFSKLTTSSATPAVKKAQREEEILQQAIAEDLAGYNTATVFLRLSTVHVQTFVSRQLSAELERATKKPPPKTTKIGILTASYEESTASASTLSGTGSKKASEIFANVIPTKTGKIFIGFPTAQTTGLLAHISAPSVIPTVERESIDLNARYVRDWNIEMLRIAGIACRIAFTGAMSDIKAKLDRIGIANGHQKVDKEGVDTVIPAAVHACQQYSFEESTPSAKVGQYVEEAFWICNTKASIDILSTRGVLPSQQVRVASEDLSFVNGIPVVPEKLMKQANVFLTKLREYGLLSDISNTDIKKELETQALTEMQVIELVKWICAKISDNDMDAGVAQSLFNGTVASISEEYVATSSSPVLQLGQIKAFVNTARLPANIPVPPDTIPYRLTRGLTPMQLQSIGWIELQIVPWLRWLVQNDGHGFGPGQSLTGNPGVASQVLPVISKAWEALSQSSKETVVDLLVSRTVIPTKLGMRKPAQAYFTSVRLFDDLPTITGLQGTKEKFLSALGVRKTVELNVVFDRLMAKSATPTADEGRWSHVDLIKYLVSVKDDIPKDDLQRLRKTPICTAERDPTGKAITNKLYRLSELYEPDEAIAKLELPLLHWPGSYSPRSAEGQFMRSLGLQPYPSVPVLVDILSRAVARSELQMHTLHYFIAHSSRHDYMTYPMGLIEKAFLPVQPFPGEENNLVCRPSQCFGNPQSAVLKFRTLRQDLQKHHAIFGVANNPPIDVCAQRLIMSPPSDTSSARVLYHYFADRLNEIDANGELATRLGEAKIVPIFGHGSEKKAPIRYVSARACFIGANKTYGDIFDFVDFGPEENFFLLRIGCKHEPDTSQLATMLASQPSRLLETLGHAKYQQLLEKIAENTTALKQDRNLWQQLRSAPCMLAVKSVPKAVHGDSEKPQADDEEDTFITEYSLTSASNVVIADDYVTYQLFHASLLTAPQEEKLEAFYAALGTPLLSSLVEEDQRIGAQLKDQIPAQNLQKLICERCRVFLHGRAADEIRHDARWLERNMDVKCVEFLQVTRRLKGYRMQIVEKRSAALHRETKRNATLHVTRAYDLFQVSRALTALIIKRPTQQDALAFDTILESDLRKLRNKGLNVDRILKQKEAETRIAETERRKREDEQRRVAAEATVPHDGQRKSEKDTALSPFDRSTITNGTKNHHAEVPEMPERQLTMPGAFDSSPEQPRTNKGKKSNFLSNIRQQLGLNYGGQMGQQMQDHMASHGQTPNQLSNFLGGGSDIPPPYQARNPHAGRAITSGTEVVTSPRELQQNLQNAIKASRAYNSNALFSPPQTNEIKETPSYCDSKPGHDLLYVSEVGPSTIKVFMSRSGRAAVSTTNFVEAHMQGLEVFGRLLAEAASLFELDPKTLNIFHDESGSAIAFNRSGSIFCNLRYFEQLHLAETDNIEGQVEAMAYWWITLCHELAHNLVSEHSAEHEYYTESFVGHYFRRMVWWVSRQGVQQTQQN